MDPAALYAPGAFALLVLNIATYLAFGIDKALARRGGRRIRENTLLVMAALGGMPGAWLARARLRHKTRKQPFTARLWASALFQASAIGWGLAMLLLD